MRKFFILFFKELRGFYLNPVFYISGAFLIIINSIPFLLSLMALENRSSSMSLVYYTFNIHWFWISFSIMIPLITMRIFSEEKKNGTIETLLTSPVSLVSVILAKYFSCLIFFIFLWLPSFANFYIFEIITKNSNSHEFGHLCGAMILVLSIGIFYNAFGCFASSLSRSEFVSAVITICFFLTHLFIGYLPFLTSRLSIDVENRLDLLSMVRQMHYFSSGLISTKPIILYISGAVLMLALTFQVLNYNRWKS